MRESEPTPAQTSVISAPTHSAMLATVFTNEIFMAKNALAACLISSALLALVMMIRAFRGAASGAGMKLSR